MKVIKITTFVVSAFVTLSCGDGMDAMPDSSSNITVPLQQPATVNNAAASADTDGINNPIAPAPNLNSAALNPAHGQPGHRCDIPVGKPLNSKPATTASTVSTPAVNPTPVLPSPLANPVNPSSNPVLPSTTTAGLNPKHGQPGHRCDIKVGEPLNSKPFTTAPVSTSPVTTAPALPNISPLRPAANTTPVAPGMNPPHGQPGHRCDIAVGKPLNSKPPL